MDAAVFGKPLERGGEMVVAAVELQPGATLDEAALREHCRDLVAAYKVYEAIVKGENIQEPGIPESFKVLIKEMQAVRTASPGIRQSALPRRMR